MKLTIDTKEDSVEDIRKVMHLLSEILARKGGGAVAETVDTTNLMSMFDPSPQNTLSAGTPPDTAPNFSSLLKLAEGATAEKKEEKAEIEYY